MKRLIGLIVVAMVSLSGCSAAVPLEQTIDSSQEPVDPSTGPTEQSTFEPALYVDTDPIDWEINPNYVEGSPCDPTNFGWQFVGMTKAGNPAFLHCVDRQGGPKFTVDPEMPDIDPVTRKPLVPTKVPALTLFGYSPNIYIHPTVTDDVPESTLSKGDFAQYEKCKIAEVEDGSQDKSYGFPLPEIRADLDEEFRILVIPVQFTDHQTANKPAQDMADVVSALTSYYERSASTDVKLKWTIPDSYYQMGVPISDFELGIEFDPSFQTDFWANYQKYIQAAVDLVDSEHDFSEYDAVIVEEPRSVTDAEHGMFVPHAPGTAGQRGGIYSDEGQILNLLVTGNDEIRDIPNWIHEFGHLLGLGDRNWNTDSKPGFDVMFGWYGSPELSVWNRWLLGILKDDQVDCKTDSETSVHWIKPVAWVGDYKKGVVIPVSDHEVLVIESRRRQGFDALFGKESEGAYVYRIDTSALMYQPDDKVIVDVIAPSRSRPKGSWALDASLKFGESVTSDGWTIKVVETGEFGDVVQVSKS